MATYKIIGGDQKEYGPAPRDELLRWIAEGRLSGQSLIQSEGAGQWQRLDSFAEFADALRAQTGLPPLATPYAHPTNAGVWSAQILARNSEIHIGHCLSNACKLCFANFGLLFGATFIVWLLGNLSGVLQLVSHFLRLPPALNLVTGGAGMLWGIVYFILHGVFYGGLYLIFLNRIRGEPASVADVFGGFKLGFVQLLLVGVVSALLAMVGFFVCVLPGIYLMVAWVFSKALVADKRLEFWSAMELSRKVTTRVWFDLFVLILVAFVPTILAHVLVQIKLFVMIWPPIWNMVSSGQPDISRIMGLVTQMTRNDQFVAMVLLPRFVLLLNLPFVLAALMYAYENLFGVGPRQPLSRQTAWGCLTTNLALPGFGSLIAGRVVGYFQAALTVIGFGITVVFGLRFIIWCLKNWSRLYGPESDPSESLSMLSMLRWPLLGMGVFAFTWLWALGTSESILREAKRAEAAKVPPRL